MTKTLLNFTEKDIEGIADSLAILERGRKYYWAGRVKSVKTNGNNVSANVVGTELYEVNIYFENGKLDGDCTCPYNYGCKHMVAVLCKLLDNRHSLKVSKLASGKGKSSLFSGISPESAIKPFVEIAGSNWMEIFCKAYDIINSKKIKIKLTKPDRTLAKIYDGKTYNVEMRKSHIASYRYNFLNRCSCNEFLDRNFCAHIASVLFLMLKKAYPEAIAKHEAETRKKLTEEKYNILISQLAKNAAIINSSKNYKLAFEFEKNHDRLLFRLKKAPVLKGGKIGNFSSISENFIKNNYKNFSEDERRILDTLFNSLENSEVYHDHTIKDSFSSSRDMELLQILRELYAKEPERFSGIHLPDEKALVEFSVINFRSHKKKMYRINIMARIGANVFNLNNQDVLILGQEKAWVYKSDGGRGILAEVATEGQRLKSLIKVSGMEMDEDFFHKFIDDHYLRLSELGNIELPKEHVVNEISDIYPKPRLFLKDYSSYFCIELRFLYGDKETTCSTNYDIMFRDKNSRIIKIKRNKEEEEKLASILASNTTRQNGTFLPLGDPLLWLTETANNLIAQGFEIYGHDKLLNCRIRSEKPFLKLGISSGINWFDLEAEASYGKEKVSFKEIASALSRHERFVKLSDGTLGVIPKKWLSQLSGVIGFLDKGDNANIFRASTAQIEIIESLLGIANKASIDEKYESIRKKFKAFREIRSVELPKNINGELRPYQKAGYDWLYFLKEFSFGGCLADEMGLGKTLQVLALLLNEKQSGNKEPSLIVVPTSLVFNWVNEIQKFTPSLTKYVHHGHVRASSAEALPDVDIIITTYGTLKNDEKILKNKNFHYIVLDESQKIKNPFAKVTKAAYTLKSKHRLVLTGTPIENNYLDLWSQFAFLNPGLLGNMDYFKESFMNSMEKTKQEERMAALRNMINPFILMRKKETVDQQLPEKQITTLYCKMNHEQRDAYESWKEKYRREIQESIEQHGFMQSKLKILQGIMRLRQVCNHPRLVDESFTGESGKFSLLSNHIEEVIGSGHKALVFSSFVKMLHLFRDYFSSKGIKFSYLDGGTRDREAEVDKFQNDPDVKIFLISIKAGGFGLNLTAADYVYIIDPWWNPAVEMQAIDRAHRIGQTNKVFIYKAITKDSIEEKILELQNSKLEIVKKVITSEDGIFKQLNKDDINNMFG